jgi:hypothetical protein
MPVVSSNVVVVGQAPATTNAARPDQRGVSPAQSITDTLEGSLAEATA